MQKVPPVKDMDAPSVRHLTQVIFRSGFGTTMIAGVGRGTQQ